MKRRIHLFLALFFVVSTLTAGLHELMPHHDSSNCQVCTLVQNDSALMPQETTLLDAELSAFGSINTLIDQIAQHQNRPLGSRAPPLFS